MKLSLKKYNVVSIFFSLGIPFIFNSLIIVFIYSRINNQQLLIKKQYKKIIQSQITNNLNALEMNIKLIAQNDIIKDYVQLNESQRPLVENRVYSLLHNLMKSNRLFSKIEIFDSKNNRIFTTIPNGKINYTFLYNLEYNDQGINITNSNYQGYIKYSIDSSSIITSINNLDRINDIKKNNKNWYIDVRLKSFENTSFWLPLLVTIILSLIGSFIVVFLFQYQVLIPLNKLYLTISKKKLIPSNKLDVKAEISQIERLFIDYEKEIITTQEILLKQKEKLTFINTARQVAHDIRSPLTALKMTLDDTDNLKSDTKLILINSINRIEDIANNLLDRSRKNTNTNKDIIHVLSFLSEFMTQKRAEFKNLNNLLLDTNFSKSSYSAFIDVNKTKFSIVLSNIINNAIESVVLHDAKVHLEALSSENNIIIKIIDNGPGIPKNVLDNLGTKQVSFNKEKGNGLGLLKSFDIIKESNGKINIQSSSENGTQITITLPKVSPPAWFQSEIHLKKRIIILDDDKGIQQTWLKRFKQEDLLFQEVEIFHSPNELIEYLKNINIKEYSFLLDYEINNSELNGVDIIKKITKNGKNNFLVTSHYEDPKIQHEVVQYQASIVPKPFLSIVPILKENKPEQIILIDNDTIIRNLWQRMGAKANINVLTFININEFIKNSSEISPNTCIYVDSNLDDSKKGEIESLKIYNAGFKNIFLATGDLTIDISKLYWIKGIVDKSFPC